MFSQSAEEKYILDYFGDFIGTFLSIGENDGETFSNVRALALRKWSGAMVEPAPIPLEKLRKLYNGHKGFYIYPYAISTSNGKDTLQVSGSLCSASDSGLVSTFHPQEMARFKGTTPYTPTEVKIFRWRTFYNRLTIKTFDFISIDAEGSDLDILQQMDLNELKTKCICLEWNGKSELKQAYEVYLPEVFKLIYTSGENLIYAR